MKYINIFFSYLFFPLNITTEYIQKLGYYLRDQKKWSHKKMFMISFSLAITSLIFNYLIYGGDYFHLVNFSILWIYHKSRKEDHYSRGQGVNIFLVFTNITLLITFIILFMSFVNLYLDTFIYLISYFLFFLFFLFFSVSTLVFTLKKDPPKNKRKEEKVAWLEKLKKMSSSLAPAPKGA